MKLKHSVDVIICLVEVDPMYLSLAKLSLSLLLYEEVLISEPVLLELVIKELKLVLPLLVREASLLESRLVQIIESWH